jgi:hypothetical protein
MTTIGILLGIGVMSVGMLVGHTLGGAVIVGTGFGFVLCSSIAEVVSHHRDDS